MPVNVKQGVFNSAAVYIKFIKFYFLGLDKKGNGRTCGKV